MSTTVPISFFELSDHSELIAQYQSQIDALEERIDAEAQIAQLQINQVTSTLTTKVKNAGIDSTENIGILTDRIARELKKTSASDSSVEVCLQKQNVLANALNTSEITSCLSSDLDDVDDLRLDIENLKSPTTTIAASCQQLNPLLSQASGMKKCLVDNIKSITNNLNQNISKLSSTLSRAQKDTNNCISRTQYNLNKKIKDITWALAFC